MSAEFEKIVLEKFDNLDLKITGLSKDVQELKEKVDNNTNSINNLSLKVNQLEEKVEHNSNLINNLSEKVENNSNLINTISERLHVVEEKVDQQGLNFAKFENEFPIKVQALFDSFVANTESHLSYEKSIATLHAKTFHHDNRISVLEDYFKDTKLLANN